MGSAAMCDIGTSAGNVPVLNTDGKIDQSVLPGGLSGEESDPIFTASPAHGITAEDIEKWNSDETDPIFTASPAYGIKSEDIEKWNNNTSSGFSGDYNDLTNKPTLADLEGCVPVEKGGTGATTAEEALENLGVASSENVGDVSTLSTTDKTVVGAINELYSLTGDIETALEAIIGGAAQ